MGIAHRKFHVVIGDRQREVATDRGLVPGGHRRGALDPAGLGGVVRIVCVVLGFGAGSVCAGGVHFQPPP